MRIARLCRTASATACVYYLARMLFGSAALRYGLQSDGPWLRWVQRRNVDGLHEIDFAVGGHGRRHGCWPGQSCSDHVRDGAPLKIDAARQVLVRKLQVELEVVDTLLEPPITAQYTLILKQGCKSIAKIFTRLLPSSAPEIPCRITLARRSGILVHLDKAMQRDGQVRDARRTQDAQLHAAAYLITRRVLLVRLVDVDGVVDDGARLAGEGRGEAREKASTG